MLTAAALALSLSAPAQFQYLGYGNPDSRPLATQAPYRTDVAITPAWVPQLGREYHTVTWRKGVPVVLQDWHGPGPLAYGAEQDNHSRYYARVGNVVVSAFPWVRVDDVSGLQRVERARQTWLREHGYIEHPRVFRNPRFSAGAQVSTGDLKDQYDWNKIQIRVPKRPRFEVDAGERAEPREAPRVVVARAEPGRIVVRRPASNVAIISRAD